MLFLTELMLFGLAFATQGSAHRACMFGNPRCGVCRDRCSNEDVQCEMSMWAAEQILFDDASTCEAYVQASLAQPQSISKQELQDVRYGVPSLGYAITHAVFPDHSGNSTSAAASNSKCTSDILKKGITGSRLQDCVNSYIVEQGEVYLERAACEYVTEGAASAFCQSRVFGAAIGVVNKVANHYIEQPIVHAMDTVEDACAGVAESVANVFSRWFQSGEDEGEDEGEGEQVIV